jgi:hypothetical protein
LSVQNLNSVQDEVLSGRRYNRQKQIALELPTWYALLALIAKPFVEKEGLIRIAHDSQRQVGEWQDEVKLTWFKRNNELRSYGTHVPDFAINQSKKTLLAVECKNVNKRFKIYPDWLANEVLSRFEDYRQCTRLVIFSFFVPAPEFRRIIHKTLDKERIKIVVLGQQPLTWKSETSQLYETALRLRVKLSPYVKKLRLGQ